MENQTDNSVDQLINPEQQTASISFGAQVKPGIIDPRHLVPPVSPANGDMFYSNGTVFKKINAGTAGQVLKVTSGGSPSWGTNGTTGPTGPTGVTGSQGATGPTGSQGATGGPNPPTASATVTGNFATLSTSYVDITGATASITISATSNVLVIMSGEWFNNGTHFNYVKLLRGSTALCENVDYQDTINAQHMFTISTLDTSLAAGTYTYKAQMKVDNGTGTLVGAAAGGENTRLIVIAFPN